MPLQLHRSIFPKGEYAIWKIEEDASFFLERLSLIEVEQQELARIKGMGKRLEWLSSRYLVHLLSGRNERAALLKDEFGKPYIQNSSHFISLSHSNKKSAIIAAPFVVGIDLQKIVPKIERIAHKFMRKEELDSLADSTRLEYLHIFWGAKEALYKAYGRKEIDFRKHLSVKSFSFDNVGQTIGRVQKGNYDKTFTIHYKKIEDYMLVYALENNRSLKGFLLQ